MKAQSLYLHFPFCESKCHYCDFYSIGSEKTSHHDLSTFEIALQQECKLHSPHLDETIKTIFMGGGTPSMTDPQVMRTCLEPLQLEKRINSQTEWTMEANPSSVTLDRLRQYRTLGINRISMGVQALRDDLLLKLGRVHSQKKALESLDIIFESGFQNVSVDLLCGVPGQTLEGLEKAMETLTKFPITHLSCYLLTLPKTHKMYAQLPHEDQQLEHLLLIDRFMTARGFDHYEISNFAKPGCEAKHNLAYWTLQSYLGIGPSAHSYDAQQRKRWKNISSLHPWAQSLKNSKLPIEWEETLTEEQHSLETWMLALRLSRGISKNWITTHAQQLKIDALIKEGFVEGFIESFTPPSDSLHYRLTPKGFALSDSVIAMLTPYENKN